VNGGHRRQAVGTKAEGSGGEWWAVDLNGGASEWWVARGEWWVPLARGKWWVPEANDGHQRQMVGIIHECVGCQANGEWRSRVAGGRGKWGAA